MKLYRVCYYNESDSSQGFSFHKSRAEAAKELVKFQRAQGDNFDGGRSVIDTIDNVDISAKGIIDVLNMFASYPDNG